MTGRGSNAGGRALLLQLMQRIHDHALAAATEAIRPFTRGGKLDFGTPHGVGRVPESRMSPHAIDGDLHTASGLTAGQVLTATGADSFAFADPTGGAETLDDLTDVTLATPQEGDRFVFRSGQWRNERVYRERIVTNGDPDFPEIVFDDGDVVYELEALP